MVVEESGAGLTVECPKCGCGVVVTKRGCKRCNWFVFALVVLCLVGVACFSGYRWHRKIPRVNAQKMDIVEATIKASVKLFPLEEAYKRAPLSYTECGGYKLYGRTIGMNTFGFDEILGSFHFLTPDTIGFITVVSMDMFDNKCAWIMGQHQFYFKSLGLSERFYDLSKEIYSMADSPEKKERELAELKNAEREVAAAKKYLKEVEQWFDENQKEPVSKEKAVILQKDTRIHILDISDQYAKIEILDGPCEGKILFVHPESILVK